MKKLIVFILLLLAATWLGLHIKADPGYALFAYHHWTVEMPLWLAALAVITIFVILSLLVKLINSLFSVTTKVNNWSNKRANRRSRRKTNQGLIEFTEGRWQTAEKHLVESAKKSETPLINYLAAARAAQVLGAYERRDDYLRKAHQSTPKASVAISLTQAQLQLQQGQLEQSLATLTHLRSLVPKHAYVLKLMQKIYQQLQDWQKLADLLPELQKQKVLTNNDLQSLEKKVYIELLNATPAKLNSVWQQVPKYLRKDIDVIQTYTRYLIAQQNSAQAELILHDALKRSWNHQLLNWYGLLDTKNNAQRLITAEGWLKQHPQDAVLLLCLGRICIRNKLWGKARSYLESSIKIDTTVDACRELGQLLEEQLDEPTLAMNYYRKGLLSSMQHPAESQSHIT